MVSKGPEADFIGEGFSAGLLQNSIIFGINRTERKTQFLSILFSSEVRVKEQFSVTLYPQLLLVSLAEMGH